MVGRTISSSAKAGDVGKIVEATTPAETNAAFPRKLRRLEVSERDWLVGGLEFVLVAENVDPSVNVIDATNKKKSVLVQFVIFPNNNVLWNQDSMTAGFFFSFVNTGNGESC